MKQDINLMPPVEHKTNQFLKQLFVFLLIVFVFGAGIYFGIIDKINQKNLLQTQLKQHTDQIEEYGGLQQEYNDLKAQQAQIEQLTVALDALESDIMWTTLWKEIDACLPNNVIFSGLSYSEQTVSVNGITGLDEVTLSAMMNKLRQLEKVTDVSIGSYSEGQDSQSFNMTITLGEIFDIGIETSGGDETEAGDEDEMGGQAS